MSARARVAVIRGSTINPWEMQNMEPLSERFDMLRVGSRASSVPMATVGLPVHRPPDIAWVVGKIPLRFIRWRVARGVALGFQQHRLLGLERILRGCDLIHTVDLHYAFPHQAARFCRRNRRPLVVSRWENIPFICRRYAPAFRPERYAEVARTAAAVVATSRSAADALIEEGFRPKRLEVVLPGVDLERFRPASPSPVIRRKLGIPTDLPLVLFVGRLTWEKGCLDLVRAMARMKQPAHLLMVGSGPDRAILAEAAQALGLGERITLGFTLPYAAMPDLYRAADVFTLPSNPIAGWEEQFGMVWRRRWRADSRW